MCVISGDYLSKEGFAFHIEAANVTGRLFMSNLFLHNPSDATRGGGIRAAAGLIAAGLIAAAPPAAVHENSHGERARAGGHTDIEH